MVLVGVVALGATACGEEAPALTEAEGAIHWPKTSRITRVEFTRVEPAFGGATFGDVGAYEKLVGRAFGEVDPLDPRNWVIQDLWLAPRNSRGRVEYSMDVYVLRPVDQSKGNGSVIWDVPNRGRKLMFSMLNDALPAFSADPPDPGDGFLMRHGYTIVFAGWQGDIIPVNGQMGITVPIARNPDGSSITGRVRKEYAVNALISTQPLGGTSQGNFQYPYPPVALDSAGDVLRSRQFAEDPLVEMPRSDWAFADCSTTPFPGVPSAEHVCLREGFSPERVYELTYTAKDPWVLGIGFAAIRDLATFLRSDEAANPLAGHVERIHLWGLSQSGRFVRTFIQLGFNFGIDGHKAFDAMTALGATGRVFMNARFAQPSAGAWQRGDFLFPGWEVPFTWLPTYDPMTRVRGGSLERCGLTHSCPKVMQILTSWEYWAYGGSMVTTDPTASHDVALPSNVRIYSFGSAQHIPGYGAATGFINASAAICQYAPNPNPYTQALRAMAVAMDGWVEGDAPPDSIFPRIDDGTLVPTDPSSFGFPSIPGVDFTGLAFETRALDFGPKFRRVDSSGILNESPTELGRYDVLVPSIDEDGNEVVSAPTTAALVPVGTGTGWNYRKPGFSEGEICGIIGSFFPFAETLAERQETGDPRPSLEERYGTHEGYVQAVTAAAQEVLEAGFLLPEDVQRLVTEAQASSILVP